MALETITGVGSEVIQAANFVTSSILVCLGVILIIVTLLIINNLFSKYWRPVKVFTYIAAKISAEDAAAMEENREVKEIKKPSQPTIAK
jgi:hypothetical protein